MNYFLGIDSKTRVLVADFEDTATGVNHPVLGTTLICDGLWYHAAATYDGTTWRLYLNGVLETQLVVGNFTPRSDSIQHAGIGTAMTSTGVAAGFFQGTLDEVRIWNVARSAADIQATMGGPLTTPPREPDRPVGAQRSARARRRPTARAAATPARSRTDRRGSPASPFVSHAAARRVTTA